jgi:hypothetical protein
MTIVLDENAWAQEMIANRTLGKKAFETLSRVARYYLDEGMSRRDARMRLDTFLTQCDPTASLSKWSDTLDFAVKRALKSTALKIDCIIVTVPEMEKIDSLESRQIRRLAFTLLCLSKYWDAVNSRGDHWVNSEQREIMKMANINTSLKRQSLMYGALRKLDMVEFSRKVDNTNVRVTFAEGGEPALKITDFRNLGFQYLRYHGEPYFECQNCGIVTKRVGGANSRGRPQKYCKDCANEVAVKQRVDWVMRMRG